MSKELNRQKFDAWASSGPESPVDVGITDSESLEEYRSMVVPHYLIRLLVDAANRRVEAVDVLPLRLIYRRGTTIREEHAPEPTLPDLPVPSSHLVGRIEPGVTARRTSRCCAPLHRRGVTFRGVADQRAVAAAPVLL